MLNSVSFFELIDSAACINQLLPAREKRVAFAANIHLHDVALLRGARLERGAAGTRHGDLVIIGMYIRSHAYTSLCELSLRFRFIIYHFAAQVNRYAGAYEIFLAQIPERAARHAFRAVFCA